jgi:hypothetical protein
LSGRINEEAPGIDDFRDDIIGQRCAFDNLFGVQCHLAAILTHEHEHGSQHSLIPFIGRSTDSLRMVFADCRYFFKANRSAEYIVAHRNLLELLQTYLPFCAYDPLLRIFFDVTAAKILSDRLELLDNFVEGDSILFESGWFKIDVDLFFEATETIYLRNSGRVRFDIGAQNEILDCSQVEQAF